MNDVENALSRLLVERSESVAPNPGHRERTLGRARRRRLTNAVMAGVASLAIVAGGVGGVRALEPGPEPRPATERADGTAATAGEYGFWSRAGEYPFVAEGYFRQSKWQLRAATVSLYPKSDVRLTLQMQTRGRSYTSTSRLFRDLDDGLYTAYERGSHVFSWTVANVFGATSPKAETVEIRLNDGGGRIEAHVFEGYGASTSVYADYYIAFVPAGATGMVIARDADGNEIDADVIPRR